MRFAFFGIVFLIAAGFVLALLIGVAVRIAVLVGLVALILVGVGWVMRKLGMSRKRGSLSRDVIEHPRIETTEPERLPR